MKVWLTALLVACAMAVPAWADQGYVTSFSQTKGFGFIVPEQSNTEIFFHVSGLKDEVRPGDKVSYTVVKGKHGPQAINVKRN